MSFFNGIGACLTLKALLEDPKLQNPQLLTKDLKKGDESPQFDATSAFLGPSLWDKTFGEEDLKFEYMDLDEFLSENGLPSNLEEQLSVKIKNNNNNNNNTETTNRSPVLSPNHHATLPQSPTGECMPQLTQLTQLRQNQNPNPSPYLLSPHSQPAMSPMPSPALSHPSQVPPLSSYSGSSAPSSPECMALEVDFCESRGQDGFNPKKRKFSEQELKPQPLIKKSKKIRHPVIESGELLWHKTQVFVPDEMKDERYWSRRQKNNYAAKRSRDARRVKENQIAMRAGYLEKENHLLKDELEQMKRENSSLRKSLSKYEPMVQ